MPFVIILEHFREVLILIRSRRITPQNTLHKTRTNIISLDRLKEFYIAAD
jgi:hypothetical protein